MNVLYADLLSDSNAKPVTKREVSNSECYTTIKRKRKIQELQLYKKCFSPNSTYPEQFFEHRSSVTHQVFFTPAIECVLLDSLFSQSTDCTDKKRLTMLQRVTSAIHQVACGCPADFLEEGFRFAKSTAILASIDFLTP